MIISTTMAKKKMHSLCMYKNVKKKGNEKRIFIERGKEMKGNLIALSVRHLVYRICHELTVEIKLY